jgi:hypothetical protein
VVVVVVVAAAVVAVVVKVVEVCTASKGEWVKRLLTAGFSNREVAWCYVNPQLARCAQESTEGRPRPYVLRHELVSLRRTTWRRVQDVPMTV